MVVVDTPEAAIQQSPTVILRRLVDGYQISQALHVVATLGIPDLLKDGRRTSNELAQMCDVHPESLHRLLRALATVEVFRAHHDGTFSLTSVGQCLRSDAPQPVGGWAAFIGRPYQWAAWGHLLDAVRKGQTAFHVAHGMSTWEYRANHPHENAIFARAMTDLTRRASEAVLAAHDFGRYRVVMDVGGGHGALLAALLLRHSHLRGVLFDQAHVVAHASTVLESTGVQSRCEIVGGSFFDALPAGADAYILKTVLHDWDDERASQILRECRRATADHGVLVLVEWDLAQPSTARDAAFSDLQMLVSNTGRARTAPELVRLVSDVGFHVKSQTPTDIGFCVTECV